MFKGTDFITDDFADLLFEEVMENAKEVAEEYLNDCDVPVITGKLKDSGRIEKISNGYEVIWDAEYAEYVHENPNSKGFKWSEKALVENYDKYRKMMEGK